MSDEPTKRRRGVHKAAIIPALSGRGIIIFPIRIIIMGQVFEGVRMVGIGIIFTARILGSTGGWVIRGFWKDPSGCRFG